MRAEGTWKSYTESELFWSVDLDYKRALANINNESDDDFPSLEELSWAALRLKISTKALKTRFAL